MLATKKISTELSQVSSQFDLIKTVPLYCLSLQVNVGASNVQVSFSDLGLSDDQVSAKSKALIKAPAIAVFPRLRTAGNKLNNAKRQLQSKYLVNGNHRWWFVLENRIDALVDEIENSLLPLCENLKEEVLSFYEEDKADYLARLTTGIAEFLPPDFRGVIIQKYLSFFPSPDDVADGFSIGIDGPIRISSILEDAVVAEKASILSLHKQWKETISKSLEVSLGETTNEIYSIVADMIADIEKKPLAEISVKGKAKIEATLERLTLLVDFSKSLEVIGSEANQNLIQSLGSQAIELGAGYLESKSSDTFSNFLNQAKLKQKIKDIRQSFASQVAELKGSGHQKIAQWMKF